MDTNAISALKLASQLKKQAMFAAAGAATVIAFSPVYALALVCPKLREPINKGMTPVWDATNMLAGIAHGLTGGALVDILPDNTDSLKKKKKR